MQGLSIVALLSLRSHRLYHINDMCSSVSFSAHQPRVTLLILPSKAISRGSEEIHSYLGIRDYYVSIGYHSQDLFAVKECRFQLKKSKLVSSLVYNFKSFLLLKLPLDTSYLNTSISIISTIEFDLDLILHRKQTKLYFFQYWFSNCSTK